MTPLLTLIAAVSSDGYISKGQGVPWDLPADRAGFRAYVQGKWLLLGRRTYEEMLGWFSDHHPLVLTLNEKFVPFLGERVSSVSAALRQSAEARQAELVVCGGAAAYEAAMPLADRLIITHVNDALGAGVPFPTFNHDDWEPVTRQDHPADSHHAHSFSIVTYQRVRHYQHAA